MNVVTVTHDNCFRLVTITESATRWDAGLGAQSCCFCTPWRHMGSIISCKRWQLKKNLIKIKSKFFVEFQVHFFACYTYLQVRQVLIISLLKYWKYLTVSLFFEILSTRSEMLVLHPEYVCLPCQYHNIYRAFLDAVAEFQERVLQVIRGQKCTIKYRSFRQCHKFTLLFKVALNNNFLFNLLLSWF